MTHAVDDTYRACFEIYRIDFVVRVAGFVMEFEVGLHVDPKVERWDALQHEGAVVGVVGHFHGEAAATDVFQVASR